MMQLSEGIVETIVNGGLPKTPFILQILGTKPFKICAVEQYFLILSDGIDSDMFCYLSLRLSRMVSEGKLTENTVVRIKDYIVTKFCAPFERNYKLLVITEIAILVPGSALGRRIGKPQFAKFRDWSEEDNALPTTAVKKIPDICGVAFTRDKAASAAPAESTARGTSKKPALAAARTAAQAKDPGAAGTGNTTTTTTPAKASNKVSAKDPSPVSLSTSPRKNRPQFEKARAACMCLNCSPPCRRPCSVELALEAMDALEITDDSSNPLCKEDVEDWLEPMTVVVGRGSSLNRLVDAPPRFYFIGCFHEFDKRILTTRSQSNFKR